MRLVGSVGTLFGRYCGGCSSHECHTINSDFFFGGCGSLVTPLFGTPLSPLFAVSQSFGCSVPSMNTHESPLVCSVPRTWNVIPAHFTVASCF